MTDDRETEGITFARHRAVRDGSADLSLMDAAAGTILQRLIEGEELHEFVIEGDEGEERLIEVADPLRLVMSEFFGRFDYHAGCEALNLALEKCIGNRAGRPPAAVTRARKKLKAFMRARGKPGGRTKANPDRLRSRDHLWLILSDDLASKDWGWEKIAQHIFELENSEKLSLEYIRKHLRDIRRDRAESLKRAEGIEW